ncbi:MAG: DNA topoisomerase III [Spirochaetia bacterium]|nr:DNA topoisomerase III [Spirochaetia bacterium]
MSSKAFVLAEKPSVAREIAKVLGATKSQKGYIEGERYVVSWALGHLLELAEPAHYADAFRRWSLSSLPMLPTNLEQEVMEGTKDQYEVISTLLKREDISTLIIATDAGREGELVARWIIKKAGWTKEIKRLWISSQTRSAIESGFASLQDGEVYEGLYRAGEARAAADWYVGMNVTRALTCRYDAKLSAGRVQTPTLALITSKEDERDAFLGSSYWTIRANLGLFSASLYEGEEVMKIESEEKATIIVKKVESTNATITSIDVSEKKEEPPLAYDLTELQRDANTILSFSAKETLDVLQKLYEVHKIVSYPRTDSRYITQDIVATIPLRLKALSETEFGQVADMYRKEGYREDLGRFVVESKVTDHHAIIPTEQPVVLSRLSAKEKALWSLIALRFVQVLSNDYVYESTFITLESNSYSFKSRSVVKKQNGWRDMIAFAPDEIKKSEISDDLLDDGLMSNLQVANQLPIGKVRTKKVNLTPPPRYTEATLLSAMEHAGRFVEDSEIKKELKGGIGTPATRAEIIEKLISNRYIERDGKSLVPTPYGRELVRLAPDMLQSPSLTGLWERRLNAISEGEDSYELFITDIKEKTKLLVREIKLSNESFSPSYSDAKKCPACNGDMMKSIDELSRVHNICLSLSCSYEEVEIKKLKKEISTPVVKMKTVTTNTVGQTKKVIIKKKAPVHKEEDYEIVIEVIRPSKRRERRESFASKPAPTSTKPTPTSTKPNPKYTTAYTKPAPESSGATFADLLAASNKLKKERDKNRKK